MKRKGLFLGIMMGSMFFLMACSISAFQQGESEEVISTEAVQEVDDQKPEHKPTRNPDDKPPKPTRTPTGNQQEEAEEAPENEEEPQNQGNEQSENCTHQLGLVGPPDIALGAEFEPEEHFTVNWEIKNIGSCTWDTNYELVNISGESFEGISPMSLSKIVQPGETYQLIFQFTAPATEDVFVSSWKMSDGNGTTFGIKNANDAALRIEIEVVDTSNNGPNVNLTPIPLFTATPSGPAVNLTPLPIGSLFVLNAEDQVELADQTCYDIFNGEVVSCSSSDAAVKYEKYMFPMLRGINDLGWGPSYTEEPNKADCMDGGTYLSMHYFSEASLKEYICFEATYDGETVYGWVRPTYFNNTKVDFDYKVYQP
ncbi:MAG: hypothetical protein JEZ06_22610 [Anaerolineaceae bacterium]|nr:hypothetical protein [Anaerolineaceae bacterium]